jgi:phage tail sheath protein FI
VQPPGVGGLGGSEAIAIDRQPVTDHGLPVTPTTANAGSNGTAPTDAEIVGLDNGPGHRTGIQSLQDADDIRIVAAPGHTSASVQQELITQCERLRYRFAVLDGERDPAAGSVTAVLQHRNSYDSAFAAYYTPWVEIADGDNTVLLPPSGYAAGIYARVDNERGVHKAPANEVVRGITGLHAYITTGEQDILNPRGVNAIRRFEGRGIRVWGARTLSSDPEFRYVNVRRFLIFLEASLDRGTQFVVFEPNAPETWSRVVDSVTAFLHTQWRSGALFGRKPEDAFFVRCDETTMTADDILNGRLICQIGVAIVRPAEFVIFRIEQITGFAGQP